MEWSKKQYNAQYEKWVPWAEDMYLYYFTKGIIRTQNTTFAIHTNPENQTDNKASYATKGNSSPPSLNTRTPILVLTLISQANSTKPKSQA